MVKHIICYILILSCVITGYVLPIHGISKFSPQLSYPSGMLKNADTLGLLEAFEEHEEIRASLTQAVSGSISLADVTRATQYYYDYYNNGVEAYYGYDRGRIFTDDSLQVDKETATAIKNFEEFLPGARILMRMVEGRMCVVFSIVKNTTGKHEDYYQEDLIYTLFDLSDLELYGYDQIEENWYFKITPME